MFLIFPDVQVYSCFYTLFIFNFTELYYNFPSSGALELEAVNTTSNNQILGRLTLLELMFLRYC